MPWRLIAYIVIAPAVFVAALALLAFFVADISDRRVDPAALSVWAIAGYVMFVWVLYRRAKSR